MRTSLNNIISADSLPIAQIHENCMYIEIFSVQKRTVILNDSDENLVLFQAGAFYQIHQLCRML